MTVPTLPTPPNRGQDQATFDTNIAAWIAALDAWTTAVNALPSMNSGGVINNLTTTGNVAIGNGTHVITGTSKFSTTIGVGNATPAASGAGVTFPATQSASSDANTLDDYEEGTWNATFADAISGGNTSTTGSGDYTKVGRLVTANFSLDAISTAGLTAGNSIYIQGLPFVSGEEYQGAFLTYRVGRNAATVSSAMILGTGSSSLQFNLFTTNSATTDLHLLVSDLVSGTSSIYGSITYRV